MAYSDYGAFVYKNGERRRDKEDVALFNSDEETFGEDSANISSGARIWAYLYHRGSREDTWIDHIHHGIMGDNSVRVLCHKQGLPQIYEATEDGIKEIPYIPEGTDHFNYNTVKFEYNGYKFKFTEGKPYVAEMIEPDGTEWKCEYDYQFGAGFENNDEE